MKLRYIDRNGISILQQREHDFARWEDIPHADITSGLNGYMTEDAVTKYSIDETKYESNIRDQFQNSYNEFLRKLNTDVNNLKPKQDRFENTTFITVISERSITDFIRITALLEITKYGVKIDKETVSVEIHCKSFDVEDYWDDMGFIKEFFELIKTSNKDDLSNLDKLLNGHYGCNGSESLEHVYNILFYIMRNYDKFESVYNDAVLAGILD